MALVDYSGSEDSDQEEARPVLKVSHARSTANKPAFQKVIDRSNPHTVKIILPETPRPVLAREEEDQVQRPLKRPRLESGSNFNSFLPAPKRATATAGGPRLGLSKGVNLKTGSAPGFTREPMPDQGSGVNEDIEEEYVGPGKSGGRAMEDSADQMPQNIMAAASSDEQPKKKATIFKPLSVSRKPPKKKIPPPKGFAPSGEGQVEPPKSAPKISLFSSGVERDDHCTGSASAGAYQPMIYQASPDPDPPALPSTPDVDSGQFPDTSQPLAPSDPDTYNQGSQSLDSIAADLNLSASARRQLLGRHGTRDPSAINIVNFNTDEEYAANEKMRQAGETVQHNPVRAIQPGKHSLKSLVSAVATQKDALEEQFATGRRNKKEAGGKYGW